MDRKSAHSIPTNIIQIDPARLCKQCPGCPISDDASLATSPTSFSLESFIHQEGAIDAAAESTIRKKLDDFVSYHMQRQNPIALVTSGGTCVPLESHTVRFIDNFSVGQRGAASAEYLLERGYAVIYLFRKRSLEPYSRHCVSLAVPSSNIFDLLEIDAEGRTVVRSEMQSIATDMLRRWQRIREENRYFSMPFTSVQEYLQLLRLHAQAVARAGPRALLYLCAAVSDFYLPTEDRPTHKIQSASGPLELKLSLVPKALKPLTQRWCPSAFIVSFKLETDAAIVLTKARGALAKYSHSLVIANLLETRRHEVWFVHPKPQQQQQHTSCSTRASANTDPELGIGTEAELDATGVERLVISEDQEKKGYELESLIIDRLVALHAAHMSPTTSSESIEYSG